MARINLLPWREQRRKQKLIEFGIVAGLALLLTIVGVVFWVTENDNAIKHQKRRNALLDKEIKAMEQQIVEIKQLESNKSQLLSRMEVIENLQGSRPQVVHLMDELVETIPEGCHLTSVTQVGNSLNLQGKAQSNARVATYMRSIADSEWLGDAELTVIRESKGGNSRDFELNARQLNPQEQARQGK